MSRVGQERLGAGQVGEGQGGQESLGQVRLGAGQAGEAQGVGHSSGAYAFSIFTKERLGLLSQLTRTDNTRKMNLAIICFYLTNKKLRRKVDVLESMREK